MTNHTITSKKLIAPFRKTIILNEGEKLANDTELLNFTQKTVPAGYRIMVIMDLRVVKIEEV